MYLVDWSCFPTVEVWSFVGDILCLSAAHFPLVTTVICSRDAPMWAVWVLLFCGTDYCGWSGGLGWLLV